MSEKVEITGNIKSFSIVKKEEKKELTDAVKESIPLIPVIKRPDALAGITYKITPPGDENIYITINDHKVDGVLIPFEIFIRSQNHEHLELTESLCVTLSSVFRLGIDIRFLIERLKNTPSYNSYFVKGKNGLKVKGVVSHIGYILEEHLNNINYKGINNEKVESKFKTNLICPKCSTLSLMKNSGCEECLNCGYSKCG